MMKTLLRFSQAVLLAVLLMSTNGYSASSYIQKEREIPNKISQKPEDRDSTSEGSTNDNQQEQSRKDQDTIQKYPSTNGNRTADKRLFLREDREKQRTKDHH